MEQEGDKIDFIVITLSNDEKWYRDIINSFHARWCYLKWMFITFLNAYECMYAQ